jgi:hypothetical protein
MTIRDSLFASDVTRDIPPVVYFHEQSPEKLAAEVSEYIITGRLARGHPNHRACRRHPRAVRPPAHAIAAELDKPGGPDLPNAWISGFYGSGKSSFAKLLGLALDGVALPNGGSLPRPGSRRDTSPQAAELRAAWARCARRSTRSRSSSTSAASPATTSTSTPPRCARCSAPRLLHHRAAGRGLRAQARARRRVEPLRGRSPAKTLGKPWAEKDKALAEEDFSLVMSRDVPRNTRPDELVHQPRGHAHALRVARGGREAAIGDMLSFRRPGRHALPRHRRGLAVRAVQQGPGGPPARLRHRAGRAPARARLAARPRPAEARRGSRRLVPRLGQGPLPPEAARAPRHHQHPRRRPQAPAAQEAEAEARLRALFEPIAPTSSCSPTAARPSPPTSSSRSTRCCPGTSTSSCRSPARCAPLLPRPGRRPGDPRPAQLLGELFREQKLADAAGGRARHPRPGLRGAAHRARLRRAGLHGPRARQCADDAQRPDGPRRQGRRPARAHPGRPRPRTRSSSRSASTTASIAATTCRR